MSFLRERKIMATCFKEIGEMEKTWQTEMAADFLEDMDPWERHFIGATSSCFGDPYGVGIVMDSLDDPAVMEELGVSFEDDYVNRYDDE